jgi:broad specificity phosphatase PhoE
MNYCIYLLLLIFSQNTANAQTPQGISAKTNIYFVRHAEKESGNDPALTENGKRRAGDLMRYLKDKKIIRIYVTQYKRTQNTADSMYLQLGIDTIHYQADENGIDLFNKIAAHGDFNKTILIVGHSNTIPDYIKKAGVVNYPQANIADTEFDNIFRVYYRRSFVFSRLKAHVGTSKYGTLSASSAAMQ